MGMSSQESLPFAERRSETDRRRAKHIPFLPPFRRRHSRGRRRTDKGGYVDVYDLRTWAVALSVVILSLLDAILTAIQLRSGRVTEANPLLAHLLVIGGLPAFFAFKASMTALPLALIVMHKEWAAGRLAARFCLWIYVGIMLYHTYLLVESPIHGGLF
jgi:hypothetical protein